MEQCPQCHIQFKAVAICDRKDCPHGGVDYDNINAALKGQRANSNHLPLALGIAIGMALAFLIGWYFK